MIAAPDFASAVAGYRAWQLGPGGVLFPLALPAAPKVKEREVWRNEYETLEEARAATGAYVDRYHGRPHSSLDYRTPEEVRQTWEDARDAEALRKEAA